PPVPRSEARHAGWDASRRSGRRPPLRRVRIDLRRSTGTHLVRERGRLPLRLGSVEARGARVRAHPSAGIGAVAAAARAVPRRGGTALARPLRRAPPADGGDGPDARALRGSRGPPDAVL